VFIAVIIVNRSLWILNTRVATLKSNFLLLIEFTIITQSFLDIVNTCIVELLQRGSIVHCRSIQFSSIIYYRLSHYKWLDAHASIHTYTHTHCCSNRFPSSASRGGSASTGPSPENIVIHKEDTTIHIRWSPPKNEPAGLIQGYEVSTMTVKPVNCIPVK
jgi:hypothetical protein